MLGIVTAGILFHVSLKLDFEGHRWAPLSLLRRSIETGLRGGQDLDADVTSESLRAEYFTFEYEEKLRLETRLVLLPCRASHCTATKESGILTKLSLISNLMPLHLHDIN